MKPFQSHGVLKMRANGFGSLRGWEREEKYRSGNRRLFLGFLLLTVVCIGGLYLFLEQQKKDGIDRAVYVMRRDALSLQERQLDFFEWQEEHLLLFGAAADAAQGEADEEKQIARLASDFLFTSEYARSVWIESPQERARGGTERFFYRDGNTVIHGDMRDAKLPADDAWYQKAASADRPVIVAAGADDADDEHWTATLSAGFSLPSGRGYAGAEYLIQVPEFFSSDLFRWWPTTLLLSSDGAWFGMSWYRLIHSDGPSGAAAEIAAVREIAARGENAKESWRTYRQGDGSEALLYCRAIDNGVLPPRWTVVMTVPVLLLYHDALDMSIIVFFAVELLMLVIFLAVYFARRRQYYAPKKTAAAASVAAAPADGEPVQLTTAQQDYLKKLGRKRTFYRILAVLFFMPIAFGMSLTESRFAKAEAAGDIAAAEQYVRSMRNAAIAAVVIGVPILIFYFYFEILMR